MMIRFYKTVFFLFACLTSSLWIATEGFSQNLGIATHPINPYDLNVDVQRAGDAFLIHVSYIVPINICQAMAFLTNYEDAKNIPGIVHSKIISRDGIKVRVERHVQSDTIALWIEQAHIELNKLGDVGAAAASYRRAWEEKGGPYYAARIYAELLKRQGRNAEAYAWLCALHPQLPRDDEAADAPLVLTRIRELERTLRVSPEQAFRPEAPAVPVGRSL
jgi:hypothetical protein